MAFKIADTLDVIVTHLRETKYIEQAIITEPTQPPQARTAAVFMRSVRVVGLYLNGGTQEVHTVVIRLYAKAFGDPTSQESLEKQLTEAAEQVMANLFTDSDLGGNIREIDVAGINGTPVSADFGYVDIGGEMERIVDITVPINVDDSITISP